MPKKEATMKFHEETHIGTASIREKFKAEAAVAAAEAVRIHGLTRYDVDITMNAPSICLPGYGDEALLINLGRWTLKNAPFPKAGARENTTYVYRSELDQAHISIIENVRNWPRNNHRELLEEFSGATDIELNIKFPEDTDLEPIIQKVIHVNCTPVVALVGASRLSEVYDIVDYCKAAVLDGPEPEKTVRSDITDLFTVEFERLRMELGDGVSTSVDLESEHAKVQKLQWELNCVKGNLHTESAKVKDLEARLDDSLSKTSQAKAQLNEANARIAELEKLLAASGPAPADHIMIKEPTASESQQPSGAAAAPSRNHTEPIQVVTVVGAGISEPEPGNENVAESPAAKAKDPDSGCHCSIA